MYRTHRLVRRMAPNSLFTGLSVILTSITIRCNDRLKGQCQEHNYQHTHKRGINTALESTLANYRHLYFQGKLLATVRYGGGHTLYKLPVKKTGKSKVAYLKTHLNEKSNKIRIITCLRFNAVEILMSPR
jgi:hypothetical protein